MPALDRLHGARVVAEPAALDALLAGSLPAGALALRFAPDDVFIINIDAASLRIDDAHAIAVDDAGWVGAWCGIDAVAPHIEWQLPVERPALVEGSIAGVPAKLWLAGDGDEDALLLAAAAYASTLADRLGWRA